MEPVAPLGEVVREIRDAGGGSFDWCYQCGRCDVACPWNRVRTFSIRRLVRQAAFGLPDVEREDAWLCTTCGNCRALCPRGVDPVAVGTALRRVATGYGVLPASAKGIRAAAGSLAAEGNPLGLERSARDAWAEGLGVRPFAEGMEVLYFVGCYGSYDPRMRRVAAATVKVLQRAGVDFGILGTAESCCGEGIRRAGHEEVFRALARENIKTFIDRGVRRILVSSPHCYGAFLREYREFRVDFEVVHVSQFLAELLESGRLRLSAEIPKRATWHDPCYLGRNNGVFEPPRAVLRRVPGLSLVEMPENRRDSLCCGGGGGRYWMETPKGERFSDLRFAQAKETGADVLVTSCPYCIGNFEDSRTTSGDGAGPEVRDLAEVVLEALAPAEAGP